MVFKYILLVYGFCEFLFGAFFWFNKKESIVKTMIETFGIFSGDINYEDIKDKKAFSRWVGEVIIMGGSLYTFLASASIFFEINVVVVIAFIALIEIIFFKIIFKGYRKFI